MSEKQERGEKIMDWFKKHADTAVVMGLMFSGFLWMNGKFNGIEKDLAVVKTVLILKGIMPTELAIAEKK
jgi:hypothetical protein